MTKTNKNEVYTKFGHVTVTNMNADVFSPRNVVAINFPSFGEISIEETIAFMEDMKKAIAYAKSVTK